MLFYVFWKTAVMEFFMMNWTASMMRFCRRLCSERRQENRVFSGSQVKTGEHPVPLIFYFPNSRRRLASISSFRFCVAARSI